MKRDFLLIGAAALSLCISGTIHAADKVVVVPLGGAIGDAGADHVLAGKTFSNRTAKGVTGTRPPAPVADTGAKTSVYAGDDASYTFFVGVSTANRFNGFDFGAGAYDALTGLFWESNATSSLYNWTGAIDRCESKTTVWFFGGTTYEDWRLPTINELNSIIDRSNLNPALPDGTGITLPGNGVFWSSTPYALGATAWYIDMTNGSTSIDPQGMPHYTICVRGQWKFPFIHVIPLDSSEEKQ